MFEASQKVCKYWLLRIWFTYVCKPTTLHVDVTPFSACIAEHLQRIWKTIRWIQFHELGHFT